MKNNKRFLKSNVVLSKLLAEGDGFYVGISFEDYLSNPNVKKLNLPTTFKENNKIKIKPIGPTTKSNIVGKYGRKKPEEKKNRTVHIKYVRKDGTHVEFDRNFYAYVKELKHKYEIELNFASNTHRQLLIVSPLLLFDNTVENEIKNTHCINLFLEVFADFEIFTDTKEPAIGFNKKFEFEILPKGNFEDEDIANIVQGIRRVVKKEEEVRALQKRLSIIKEYNPDLRGRGPGGFFGYVVFGFEKKGYVVVESMYLGNATYIFDFDKYEEKIAMDKQLIIEKKLYKKRFYHLAEWEKRIRAFLSK